MRYLSILLFICPCALASCTSYKTTIMDRLDNDMVVPSHHPKKVHGIPVTLKVPSHVEVSITETYFVLTKPKEDGTPRTSEDYQVRGLTPRLLNVKPVLIYTPKLFTVDFVRPAGGILNLTEVALDDEQYFAKVQAEVTERTLADINTALTTLKGPLTGKTTSAEVSEGMKATVRVEERTVAFQRFDINEPDWKTRMQAFVDYHLNDCSPKCPEAGPCRTGTVTALSPEPVGPSFQQ